MWFCSIKSYSYGTALRTKKLKSSVITIIFLYFPHYSQNEFSLSLLYNQCHVTKYSWWLFIYLLGNQNTKLIFIIGNLLIVIQCLWAFYKLFYFLFLSIYVSQCCDLSHSYSFKLSSSLYVLFWVMLLLHSWVQYFSFGSFNPFSIPSSMP